MYIQNGILSLLNIRELTNPSSFKNEVMKYMWKSIDHDFESFTSEEDGEDDLIDYG